MYQHPFSYIAWLDVLGAGSEMQVRVCGSLNICCDWIQTHPWIAYFTTAIASATLCGWMCWALAVKCRSEESPSHKVSVLLFWNRRHAEHVV
jgi:hypothetical protein